MLVLAEYQRELFVANTHDGLAAASHASNPGGGWSGLAGVRGLGARLAFDASRFCWKRPCTASSRQIGDGP